MGTPASSRGGGRSKPGGNKSKPSSKTSKPPERQVKDVKGSIQPPPQYSKTTGKITEYGKQQQKLDATAVRDGNQNQVPQNRTSERSGLFNMTDAERERLIAQIDAAEGVVATAQKNAAYDYEVPASGPIGEGSMPTREVQYTPLRPMKKEKDPYTS